MSADPATSAAQLLAARKTDVPQLKVVSRLPPSVDLADVIGPAAVVATPRAQVATPARAPEAVPAATVAKTAEAEAKVKTSAEEAEEAEEAEARAAEAEAAARAAAAKAVARAAKPPAEPPSRRATQPTAARMKVVANEIREAEALKEDGNSALGSGLANLAVGLYTNAILLLGGEVEPDDGDDDDDDDDGDDEAAAAAAAAARVPDEAARLLLATCLSNRSVARLRDLEALGALRDAQAAIRLRPAWLKGHVRKGDALLALGMPAGAARAFERALKLAPDDAQLRQRYAEAAAAAALDEAEERFEQQADSLRQRMVEPSGGGGAGLSRQQRGATMDGDYDDDGGVAEADDADVGAVAAAVAADAPALTPRRTLEAALEMIKETARAAAAKASRDATASLEAAREAAREAVREAAEERGVQWGGAGGRGGEGDASSAAVRAIQGASRAGPSPGGGALSVALSGGDDELRWVEARVRAQLEVQMRSDVEARVQAHMADLAAGGSGLPGLPGRQGAAASTAAGATTAAAAMTARNHSSQQPVASIPLSTAVGAELFVRLLLRGGPQPIRLGFVLTKTNVVVSVVPGSLTHVAGFAPGDALLAINGRSLGDAGDDDADAEDEDEDGDDDEKAGVRPAGPLLTALVKDKTVQEKGGELLIRMRRRGEQALKSLPAQVRANLAAAQQSSPSAGGAAAATATEAAEPSRAGDRAVLRF